MYIYIYTPEITVYNIYIYTHIIDIYIDRYGDGYEWNIWKLEYCK